MVNDSGLSRKIAELSAELEALKQKQHVEFDELKSNFQHYELLFQQSLEGIFYMMIDEPIEWNDHVDKEALLDYIFKHQRITKVNDAIVQQYHATREQLIGLTPADLTVEDPEQGRISWRNFFDNGHLHLFKQTRRMDGTLFHMEGNFHCLYDDKGRITGHFGILRDISNEFSNHEVLKMFKQTFMGYTDGMNIADLNDRIMYANPAFCKMYGYTEAELIGKDSSFFRSEKNPQSKLIAIHAATMNGGWKGELMNKRKDGTEFPIYLTTSAVYNDQNEKIAVVGIAEDISVRKREEAEKKAIAEIINGVTSTSNLEELLKLIHRSLSTVIYAENFFIALYNDTTELFNFPYYVDKYDPMPGPLALRKSCTAFVYKTGAPLLLTQDKFDELVASGEVQLVGTNSPSWIGLPLKIPERTIGVLVLQNYEDANVYSDEDIRFLNSIGAQIALAIERKITEEELDESEEVFRRLFFESKDPILLLNETGFTDCNPAAVQILKYPDKQALFESKPWEISPKFQPDGRGLSKKSGKIGFWEGFCS